MRYEARITAYDVMDLVWITCTLHSQQDVAEGAGTALVHVHTTVSGTGESDPMQWLRDALVSALEAL